MKKQEPKHEVVQDEVYQHMYRIRYPDGILSADMYGKQWAENHCYLLNNPDPEEDLTVK